MSTELDKSIARITGAYRDAVFAKDVAALMRLYDPAVRVYDAWGTWSHEGAEPWQRTVEAWFSSLGTQRVKVSFEEPRAIGDAACAIYTAIVTYAGLAADGTPLQSMQNRLTWGLRTSGHVLRIVHEHTSAPIGFEDMKAILQRAPRPA